MMLAPPLYLKRQRQTAGSSQMVSIPAPLGGLNTIDAGYGMPDTDCPVLWNMIGAENGLRCRLGWKEWCINLTGATDNLVRSMVPFTGSISSSNRLFACTSSGIWDVSASSTTPTQVVTFPDPTGNAGYGSSCVFVNVSGGHFLLYCDEQNGYYTYSESTTGWNKVIKQANAAWIKNTVYTQNVDYVANNGLTYKCTQTGTSENTTGAGPTGTGTGIVDGTCTWDYTPAIDGVDPANFVYVMVWKNRPWFVEKNTGFAWWLSIGAIYGPAARQNFGAQFKAGGDLRGLYNWTIDGGSGPDDRLVGISGGGDVVIYEGTDPASTSTFGLVGKWGVGGVPIGRRLATDFGGDVLILTSIGLLPLSRLVLGNPVFEKSPYLTAKIASLFNRMVALSGTSLGWSVKLHPEDNSLLVSLPISNGENNQLAYSMITKGWSQYRGIPLYSMESWEGKLYFGTPDGRVCINTDYLDAVLLSPPASSPSPFLPIHCSGVTKFHNDNGRQKQVQWIRPTILAESGKTAATFEARYRYNLSEVLSAAGASQPGGSLWGTALWGISVWGGSYATQQNPGGAASMGPDVAIAWRIEAESRTVLVAMDVALTQGGPL